MDKTKLNNEIVLCRPAVRRARVIVIRKILKKMKILKSCKIDSVKEKKIKKADKLFKRIQIMKKLKDDEVTKFALLNEDYESLLKSCSKNQKKSALACLAKHDDILKRVTKIREQIPDWKTGLPLLLKGSKKKQNLKKGEERSSQEKVQVAKTGKNDGRRVCDKTGLTSKVVRKKKVETGKKSDKYRKEKIIKLLPRETESVSGNNQTFNSGKLGKSSSSQKEVEEIKVDDPFFIEKKITIPKLLLNSQLTNSKEIETNIKHKMTPRKTFHNLPLKKNKNCISNEEKEESKSEKLHPSWAAKKMKLIKPFEGKKIKFSDD